MNRQLPSQSSSSSTSKTRNSLNLVVHLSQRHLNLASLPVELCPPSFPMSSRPQVRAQRIKQAVTHAVDVAGGDPTHPKWGLVSRLVKMGCTSRGYVGAAAGVRVGDSHKPDVEGVQWMLPETYEEWREYEGRWGHKFGKSADSRQSKYWMPASAQVTEQRPTIIVRTGSRATILREKVTTWQATVRPLGEDTPVSQPVEAIMTQQADTGKGKEKEQASQGSTSQTSLEFFVVKRSRITTNKHGKGTASDPAAVGVTEDIPSDARVSPNSTPAVQAATEEPIVEFPSLAPANTPRIAEISEMSFLPPSFPSQLRTSTPQLSDKAQSTKSRQKPAPISPRLYPSSPLSSPPPTQEGLPMKPAFSLVSDSPVKQATKRARSNTPPSAHANVLPHESPGISPPAKKARLAPEPRSSAPPPPSTPPPATSSAFNEPTTPPVPILSDKCIDNARGLLVPTTPEHHALPTLTELLASSRRPKLRPRPPSRKAMSRRSSPQGNREDLEPGAQVQNLPALDKDREPSPTRSYFSSPASGSSDSSASSTHYRPRSPVSPLFTQNSAAFAPAYVSSQALGPPRGDFLGVGGISNPAGIPPVRGSSGIFGMGYNSQFDVEGQVDRVSELLERDVDYDGWLCDIPEVEDESMPLAQSQGEVGV